MNIHLPAILMFTRGTRFWHTAIYDWQFVPESYLMCFVVSLTRLNGLPMKKNRCEEKHIVPSRKWTLQAELCVASGWCLHHHPISPENWGPRGDSKDARWPGKHGRFRFCKHSASYPNKHLLSKLLILTSCIDAVSTFHPTPPPHIDHTTQAWFRNFEKNRDIQ